MEGITRTNTFSIKFKDHERAMELGKACSALWNVVNYKRRQSWLGGDIDWDPQKDCRSFWETDEEYRSFAPNIGSATAQQIIRKNDAAWRSFFKLRKLKRQGKMPPNIRKVNPPGYWKDRKKDCQVPRILVRKDCYKIRGRTLRMPKGIRARIFGNRK